MLEKAVMNGRYRTGKGMTGGRKRGKREELLEREYRKESRKSNGTGCSLYTVHHCSGGNDKTLGSMCPSDLRMLDVAEQSILHICPGKVTRMLVTRSEIGKVEVQWRRSQELSVLSKSCKSSGGGIHSLKGMYQRRGRGIGARGCLLVPS